MSAAEKIEDGVDVRTEVVNIKLMKEPPEDYHCRCRFCTTGFRGVLVRKDGSRYSRTDRWKYYSPVERMKVPKEAALSDDRAQKKGEGHVGTTPLHIARWAIQAFSKPGEWVLDPTMGAGTTAVEALNHNRNVFGVEIQTIDIIEENIKHAMGNLPASTVIGSLPKYDVVHGDARDIEEHMRSLPRSIQFSLVVNNPPYSGDQRAHTDPKLGKDPKSEGGASRKMFTVGYDKAYANLAFLKENQEYWDTIRSIYSSCAGRLRPGGHFVVGVKDMMRNKVADELHRKFAEVLESIPGMQFEGVVILPHHPTTLNMNTYRQWHPEAKLPLYQSIIVFRKVS